jgi:hypothetical protein
MYLEILDNLYLNKKFTKNLKNNINIDVGDFK